MSYGNLTAFLAMVIASFAYSPASFAQQKGAPQVKVNMINACQPTDEDKQQIASALGLVPRAPKFGPDFEVDRGRSTLDEKPDFLQAGAGGQFNGKPSTADWVRIRREFPASAMFSTVQYSFSTDPASSMIETLVFRVRDPKDLLEVTIEDSASAVTTPAAMLSVNTPASRIKLERFGKSSVVLTRCSESAAGPAPDQSEYEPLFKSASDIVMAYRGWMGARRSVPEELARVSTPAPKTKPISDRTAKPTPQSNP